MNSLSNSDMCKRKVQTVSFLFFYKRFAVYWIYPANSGLASLGKYLALTDNQDFSIPPIQLHGLVLSKNKAHGQLYLYL